MKNTSKMPTWNLSLLYTSPEDPQIEKDVVALERMYASFAKKYDTKDKKYLSDPRVLLKALTDLEKIRAKADWKPVLYFNFINDTESKGKLGVTATSQISLLENRLTKAVNAMTFFGISIGQVPPAVQNKFLAEPRLAHYKVFLSRIFKNARYNLSVPEENILKLKGLPAYDMWIMGNERMLGSQTVLSKGNAGKPGRTKDTTGKTGKKMPLSQALNTLPSLSTAGERKALAASISEAFKKVAPFSEAEINAVVTNKKINDELRGHATAYEATVLGYRNDPKVVENLVDTVTQNFPVAHSFYKLKAKLLKQKKLAYSDRAAKIGTVKAKFTFSESVKILKNTFGSIDIKYADILQTYVDNGQIDALPRLGKQSGAYCAGTYENPTFVLLNHVDTLYSLKTFAHEMGHAFHGELSRGQGPIYSRYSTSLAETASTLFESLAMDSVFDSLSDAEKITVLHDQISDNISTIFRQIACFNFEKEIHATVRAKGFIAKEALAELHNKHMKAYLGPVFDLTHDDGYFFVGWSHIRRFFYVYSYAYGMLVSKALIRRYRADKTFWKSIERFLAAGGKASPEEILAEIGIDVGSPNFFLEGIREIEEDIKKLKKLTE